MAKKQPLTWMVRPTRPRKSAIPTWPKAQVDTTAKGLVETVLKLKFIKPPKKPRFNYIIDVAACAASGGRFKLAYATTRDRPP
jgi:hypothetical protein